MKIGYKIGIFAEGITRKAETQDFGFFEDIFLRFAKRNKSWIQPITLLWTGISSAKRRVIVNFGKAFQMKDMGIDEGMKYFIEMWKRGLEENLNVLLNGGGGKV